MYRLTEKRLAEARPVFEKYRAQLFASEQFNASAFESELRQLWDTGYQEMKSIALQLLEHDRFREVAVYYMEHSNSGSGVAAEFKVPLAKVYGIKYYDASERENARKDFWAGALHVQK